MITIPWFHPAFRAGGPVQSIVNLVNNYDECSFYIVCGNTDLNKVPLLVETGKWLNFNDHTKVFYLAESRRSEAIVNLCNDVRPDVLMIIGIFSWHFNIVPLGFCKAGKKILSVRGMLHSEARGQKPLKKKMYFALWKLFGLEHKAIFHATDDSEKQIVIDFFQEDLPVAVAANYPRLFSPLPVKDKKEGFVVLASVALISPMKNILLVLQALKSCSADVCYHIYGPVKDPAYWMLCKELIVTLPVNIKVQYHGELAPSGVEAALESCHIFILPSRSENFGHAHLEALSAGRPLISSNNIPWKKLEENKAGLNVNSTVEDLCKSIQFFAAMNFEELSEWSAAAGRYSKDAFSPEKIKDQYQNLFSSPSPTEQTR